ncbi:MAG: UDP-N-acetylmuramoyl-L-alanine--D-glutamate ligase [Spirochaetales bacterium]|nr:UDP-N-acetylmuramoyl-L-alanine--D-glutamate ligase [Spirochaetales bacterium]
MNVLIFGLGNHGGGAGAAEYFCKKGHNVTVTDLRPKSMLRKSLQKLSHLQISYHLNGHTVEDVKNADLIIKNPAAAPENPLLQYNSNIQSDLSYTLPLFDIPILAVTGTKGKSTASASTASAFTQFGWKTFLMGNIGISPFSVLENIVNMPKKNKKKAIIILEISSWQLRDLAQYTDPQTYNKFFSMVVVTSLFHDHLNIYQSYKDYVSDKMLIFSYLKQDGIAVIPKNTTPELLRRNISPGNQSVFTSSSIIDHTGFTVNIGLLRKDLIPAAAACINWGYSLKETFGALQKFTTLPHRREVLATVNGVTYINDSAATVPESINFCLSSFKGKIHLISGGTDKKLETGTFIEAYGGVDSLHLLGGSLTEKLIPLLVQSSIPYTGPHWEMEPAFSDARKRAEIDTSNGFSAFVILSPGAASFDLFLNAIERGELFRNLVTEASKSVKPGKSL